MAAAPIEAAVLIGLDQASTVRLPDNEPSDAARAFLLAVIGSGGSWREAPSTAVRDQLRRLTAGWRAASAPPQDLVGRPCPMPPPAWHLARLCDLLDQPRQPDHTVDHARRLYHARCLGHLLMPEQSEFRPVVTILIPVYNRTAMAVEAVESCLAQTWRPIEILVIDDGSTDDLAAALARFGEAVRVWRQPNGGVSSARNAGIRLAGGDFVHFLDSDNLLLPTAVSRKLDAFAHIADAELCYSLAEIWGERALDLPRIAPPDGSALCPTTGLLAAASHPFYISCVMLSRWALLDSGGFEEDLRRGEDTRFWIRLGLRDTKAVALAAHLTVRRLTFDSLSVDPTLPPMAFLVRLRTIVDLLRRPRGWHAAARSFPGLLHLAIEQVRPPELSDLTARGISDLLGAISELGDGSRRDGMSPLPLLAFFRHRTKGAIDLARSRDGVDRDFLARLFAAFDDAARGAAPLNRSDVAFWAGARLARSGRPRIGSFLTAVNVRLAADPALLAISDRLLRRSAIIPPPDTIDSYIRLRRWLLPPRLAMWLARPTAGAPRRPRTR